MLNVDCIFKSVVTFFIVIIGIKKMASVYTYHCFLKLILRDRILGRFYKPSLPTKEMFFSHTTHFLNLEETKKCPHYYNRSWCLKCHNFFYQILRSSYETDSTFLLLLVWVISILYLNCLSATLKIVIYNLYYKF